jgi:predicted nucleic acid-binding protein
VITLDANLLIAHLYPADLDHQAAVSLLRAHAAEGFLIHSLNFAEVLVGGVRIARSEEMLDDLNAIGVTVADRTDGESLRLAKLRVSTKLKLPDCCALDTAMTATTPLATFDDALANATRQHGVTVLPAR